MLSTSDHRRDAVGLTYVYPVVSRRAGGVSVGINLNPNNACNWACVYCQVEGLTRGGPPPIEQDLLLAELDGLLAAILEGDFLARAAPEGARQLVDVAFSGNGEPTSADGFDEIVGLVCALLEKKGLRGRIPLRLITNGSLLHRPGVQAGIKRLGDFGGEVWFKLDRALPEEMACINGTSQLPEKSLANLEICAGLAATWVQTCWFALDGVAPGESSRQAYCDLLRPLAGCLAGVHLYGLARPSMQPEAPRLARIPEAGLRAFAAQLEKETGLRVLVSP